MRLIFEFDPRDRLTHWHMASIAFFLSFLWSISLFVYLFLSASLVTSADLPVFIVPVCLNGIVLLLFLLPMNFLNLNSTRKWLKERIAN